MRHLLLLLPVLARLADARVVGVWTDIEDTQTRGGMTFIETLREATDIAHSAGLRFAVDAQVGWAFENVSAAASRPTHMAVMDIVDEVTMMDYFSGCVDPLSTEGMPCHITQAVFFLAPFLTYANFLQRMHNRTVLLDVGLGVAYPGSPSSPSMDSSHGGWSSHRFHTELQLEKFLAAAATFIREMEGGPTSGDPHDIPGSFHTWCWTQPQTAGECPPGQRGPFNKFALFEHQNYLGVTADYPCPKDEEVCAPSAQRPPRALWMYDMEIDARPGHDTYANPLCNMPTRNRTSLGTPGDGFQCNVLYDKLARARFFAWCKERAITELYVDANGDAALRNATAGAALESFVEDSDKAGIDLQFYGGEDAGMGTINATKATARWCLAHPHLCGAKH